MDFCGLMDPLGQEIPVAAGLKVEGLKKDVGQLIFTVAALNGDGAQSLCCWHRSQRDGWLTQGRSFKTAIRFIEKPSAGV
jgi:hypothetical protein